ncbi:hypothetical protein HQ531_13110 [bacterium]|nr:hypothetical protein [bacterium]
MRPRIPNLNNPIDTILDESWVDIPKPLQQRLEDIPTHALLKSKAYYERTVLFLNIILTIWCLSLIFIFKGILVGAAANITAELLSISADAGKFAGQPIMMVITVGILGLGWFRYNPDNS